MRVFIWKRVQQATERYHSAGGVVVFAYDEILARQIANAVAGCHIEDDEHPDESREVVAGLGEAVYIFPDAGCC